MDHLITVFRRLYRPDSSPLVLIYALATCCPDEIQFDVKNLGGNNDEQKYMAKIAILGEKSRVFVSNGAQEMIASETVSKLVYNYLKYLASIDDTKYVAQPSPPPQVHVGPTKSPVQSSMNSSGSVKAMVEEEYAKIVDIFQAQSYTVEHEDFKSLDDENFERVYNCCISIPGLGDFASKSYKSKVAACRESIQKVKDYCRQYLPLELLSDGNQVGKHQASEECTSHARSPNSEISSIATTINFSGELSDNHLVKNQTNKSVINLSEIPKSDYCSKITSSNDFSDEVLLQHNKPSKIQASETFSGAMEIPSSVIRIEPNTANVQDCFEIDKATSNMNSLSLCKDQPHQTLSHTYDDLPTSANDHSPKKSPLLPTCNKAYDRPAHLLESDFEIIKLLNLYNKVADLYKPPLDLLNELLYSGQVSFSILTTPVEKGFMCNMYLTQIKHEHFGTFFAIASSEHESREKCAVQVFDSLAKINNVVSSYRIVQQKNSSQRNWISILIAQNSDVFKFHVWAASLLAKSTYNSSIFIERLVHFYESGGSEQEASEFAFNKMANYLAAFCEKIEHVGLKMRPGFSSQPVTTFPVRELMQRQSAVISSVPCKSFDKPVAPSQYINQQVNNTNPIQAATPKTSMMYNQLNNLPVTTFPPINNINSIQTQASMINCKLDQPVTTYAEREFSQRQIAVSSEPCKMFNQHYIQNQPVNISSKQTVLQTSMFSTSHQPSTYGLVKATYETNSSVSKPSTKPPRMQQNAKSKITNGGRYGAQLTLINAFNLEYDPSKSKVAVMKQLITSVPSLLKMSTNRAGGGVYKTTVTMTLDNTQNFIGSDQNCDISQEQALITAFRKLNNLAFMFQSFKLNNVPGKMTSEIFDDLIDGKLVSYNTKKDKSGCWQTDAEIVHFSKFNTSGENVMQSTGAALEQAKQFLAGICGQVNDSPHALSYIKEPKGGKNKGKK